MERIDPAAKLDGAQFNLLQEILERFELDCSRGVNRPIREYLPATNGPFRDAVLEELVRTDLEMRWRQRRGVLVEHYFADFPELRNQSALLHLVEDEYRLRQRNGDNPRIADFQARFPALADQLASLTEDPKPEAKGSPMDRPTPPPTPVPKRRATDVKSSLTDHDPAAEDSSQLLPAQASQFKKVRRIGKGAFGEVWEAIGPGGVPVAVKRIFGAVSASAVKRERASLDLICSGKLRHPFLLQVFGWWIEEERLHIAMELADGTVEELLKQAKAEGKPGMSVEDLRQLFCDAADALDFLNFERNILHRDVKPANMLLMARRLKLCDFGLARMTENLMLAAGRTRGAGTPVFIAPEIVIGYQSPYSDQYSLAASYYMLRTGKPIFTGKVEAIREQHVSATPKLEDDVLSEHEQEVLKKALSKAPEQRYPSSTEFVNDLFAGVANPLRKSGPLRIQADWSKALEVGKTEIVAEGGVRPGKQAADRVAPPTPAAAVPQARVSGAAPAKNDLDTSNPDIDTLPPESKVAKPSGGAPSAGSASPPHSPSHGSPRRPIDMPTMPVTPDQIGPVPKPTLKLNAEPQALNPSLNEALKPVVAGELVAEKTVPIKHPFEAGQKQKKRDSTAPAPPPTPDRKPSPSPVKKSESVSGGSIRPLKPARGTALERLQRQQNQEKRWQKEQSDDNPLMATRVIILGFVCVLILATLLVVLLSL